ncbi:MAG TPA: Hsp20/alpha crystallin family protein [Oculatellaceae cyanobacterium]
MKNAVVSKENTHSEGKSIHPHRPYPLVHRLRNDLNRIFDDIGEALSQKRHDSVDVVCQCQAKVDVKETDKQVIITAEVPGVEMSDLQITATPHYICIAGEKKCEKEEKNKGYYQMERKYGFFRRVLPLPCEIDKDHADAIFKNGVLTVTLPKTEAALKNEYKVVVKAG